MLYTSENGKANGTNSAPVLDLPFVGGSQAQSAASLPASNLQAQSPPDNFDSSASYTFVTGLTGLFHFLLRSLSCRYLHVTVHSPQVMEGSLSG